MPSTTCPYCDTPQPIPSELLWDSFVVGLIAIADVRQILIEQREEETTEITSSPEKMAEAMILLDKAHATTLANNIGRILSEYNSYPDVFDNDDPARFATLHSALLVLLSNC